MDFCRRAGPRCGQHDIGSEDTMRAETQARIDDIKQSLALLRRHL